MRSTRRLAALAALAAGLPLLAQQAPAPAPPPAPAGTISPEGLAPLLGTPGLVLVDARGPLRPWAAGHLAGALPAGADNLRSTAGGVPAALYPFPVLSVFAERLGITKESHVVVYGEQSDPDATFVATALALTGVPKVSILDGGFARWTREGRPVTTARALAPSGKGPFTPDVRGLATWEDVLAARTDGKTVILDVRPPDQYQAGYIPGAKSRFWKKDLVEEGPLAGSLRPVDELRSEYAALGITKGTPVVVTCNTGHQASTGYYVLRHVLGYPDVRLYQGSWVDWSLRPGVPIAAAK